jgi:hypothetical protein
VQSEEKGVETEEHTETRAEEQPTNHDEGVMEEQGGFEEVVYGPNRRRQREQVIIGTYREREIKAENKKAWTYLGRMTQETTTEGVRSFLNRKGIKEDALVEELKTMGPYKVFKLGFPLEHLRLTKNPEFWPHGDIIRQFRISYRACRQHRGASVDM